MCRWLLQQPSDGVGCRGTRQGGARTPLAQQELCIFVAFARHMRQWGLLQGTPRRHGTDGVCAQCDAPFPCPRTRQRKKLEQAHIMAAFNQLTAQLAADKAMETAQPSSGTPQLDAVMQQQLTVAVHPQQTALQQQPQQPVLLPAPGVVPQVQAGQAPGFPGPAALPPGGVAQLGLGVGAGGGAPQPLYGGQLPPPPLQYHHGNHQQQIPHPQQQPYPYQPVGLQAGQAASSGVGAAAAAGLVALFGPQGLPSGASSSSSQILPQTQPQPQAAHQLHASLHEAHAQVGALYAAVQLLRYAVLVHAHAQ